MFEASVNKMIKLDFSKLGILLGYQRPDYVERGILIAIHTSKLANSNTNIIQASLYIEIYHTLLFIQYHVLLIIEDIFITGIL